MFCRPRSWSISPRGGPPRLFILCRLFIFCRLLIFCRPSSISQLVYFSSRGPTADRRLKPDIVCPGEPARPFLTRDGESARLLTSV